MFPTAALVEARTAYERCRKRYTTIDLPYEAFLARLEEIVSAEAAGNAPDLRAAISRLQLEDLYLAVACSRGDRIAWEYFADDYLAMIRKFALRACRNPSDAEDLAQNLVARLMEDGSRLGSYNGRGSLSAWLRVSVAHAAIDRFRRNAKQVSLEATEEESGNTLPQASVDSPAEDRLDRRWGPVLCSVVTEEIRKIPTRDRLILCLYYLQAVPLKLIGRHFRVHEATASRWLDGLRRKLRKNVERELSVRYGLKSEEIQSLWVWASGVDGFSLEKVLGKMPELDMETKRGAGP
jgi:RNA polymerase sigma-70 factor, ECF subfamily